MRIEFEPSRELYPFESRWLEADGFRMHYIDEGSGQPLLMLHGNPTWSFLYRNLISRLRQRFRCVAPDYPGFGLSDRPDGYGYTPAEHARVVARLVGELDLRELIVIGQDWGGPIGTWVATQNPERVSGSLFMNTWFWPADDYGFRAFSRVMSSRPLQRWIVERNFFVERIMPAGTTSKLAPEVLDHYRRAQPTPEARRGVAEFPRQIIASGPWLKELEASAPEALGTKPMSLIFGRKDRALGRRAVIKRWQRYFPEAELTELPRANHYLQEDAPEEIAGVIERRFG